VQGLYVALNALRNMIKAKAQNDLLVKDVYMAVNTVADTVQKLQANFTLDCISATPDLQNAIKELEEKVSYYLSCRFLQYRDWRLLLTVLS